MPRKISPISREVFDEYIKAERSLIRISNICLGELDSEALKIQDIYKESIDREERQKAFENFDQKANQLFNLISSVMKAMNEMRSSTVRNLL